MISHSGNFLSEPDESNPPRLESEWTQRSITVFTRTHLFLSWASLSSVLVRFPTHSSVVLSEHYLGNLLPPKSVADRRGDILRIQNLMTWGEFLQDFPWSPNDSPSLLLFRMIFTFCILASSWPSDAAKHKISFMIGTHYCQIGKLSYFSIPVFPH
jgi:hypothetical protein